MRYFFLYPRHLLIFILWLIGSVAIYAQKSRIQGKILDEQKRPLAGALVVDKETNEVLGATDDDGNYSALVTKNQVLIFESVGCKDKEVNVKGRQVINVTLETEAIKLQDVEVVAKLTNKVMPEPTEIEIKGNYFHLRTRVRVPEEMAKSNTRLIFQPYISDVTAKKRAPLKPLVLDGKEYTITQNRMYSYQIDKDPLIPYLYKPDSKESASLLPYHDSIYITDQHHDFRGEVLISMENYTRAFYRDSFVIAKGTVNPLRFFDYELPSSVLDESSLIPKPALQLRSDKGEVELVFLPNKSDIDLSIPKNVSEIDRMKSRLDAIERDPNSNLQSFEVFGVASPDGIHQHNEKLAKVRMNSAANTILGQLSQETRQFLKIKTDASVASWTDVVALMRKDSLAEAEEVQSIIDKYPKDIDFQGRQIKRLPFYQSLISPVYLPKLRRVAYQFEYSVFRSLNNDEIRSLYSSDPGQLTRYEFYRMFEMTQDTAKLRVLYNQSLNLFPKFLLAANRLAVLNLSQNCPNDSILEPFINKKAPQAVLMNQVMTLLKMRLYTRANELLAMIPLTPESEELHGIVGIFNGDFELGYEHIAEKGGINEVLLLLAMKRNEEAYKKAELLPSDIAVNEYIKAVAANRLDKVGNAIMYLENAFMLDPHLREVASIDGDVNDLL
ncbi:MAG: carboxypeptidase-like regulatory domain-containing protein [Bacteroidales bacterium]